MGMMGPGGMMYVPMMGGYGGGYQGTRGRGSYRSVNISISYDIFTLGRGERGNKRSLKQR